LAKTVQQSSASLAILKKHDGNNTFSIIDGFEKYLEKLISEVLVIFQLYYGLIYTN